MEKLINALCSVDEPTKVRLVSLFNRLVQAEEKLGGGGRTVETIIQSLSGVDNASKVRLSGLFARLSQAEAKLGIAPRGNGAMARLHAQFAKLEAAEKEGRARVYTSSTGTPMRARTKVTHIFGFSYVVPTTVLPRHWGLGNQAREPVRAPGKG